MADSYYWLKVGHKLVEISRCPSCGEAVQNAGPCEVCFQAVWFDWLARKVLLKDKDDIETETSE